MADEKKRDTFVRSGGTDVYIPNPYGYSSEEKQEMEKGAASAAPPEGTVSRALEEEAALARGEPRPERDPETEFMANAERRAYDQELEALAGLALFRSYMSQMGRGASGGGILPPPSKEEMDARLRKILDDEHG